MLKVRRNYFLWHAKPKLAKAAVFSEAGKCCCNGGYWFLKVARCACRRHPAGSFSTTPKFMTNIVRRSGRGGLATMKITPEQAREALDAWVCRPGMTQEQATILITEAFWALKERPNIDVQRVTDERWRG